MIIISTKNSCYLFITVLFLGIFTLPHISFASPLWYQNIVSINGDKAIIETRGLENKYYFSCSIKTLDCEALAEAPLKETQNTTTTKTSVKFPSNSSRRNISSTGRFGFYTKINTFKKTRTFGIIDGQKNKQYQITNYLSFWNLLDQQPHISRFAQDDSTLTYLDDRSGFMSLYIVPLNSLSKNSFSLKRITSDVSVGDFMYTDNHTILYVANTKVDPYNWILYSYDISSKIKIILAQNIVYDTILYKSGDSILFTQLTPLGTQPMVLKNYKNGELKGFDSLMQTPTNTNTITYTYQKVAGMNTVLMKNTTTSTDKHPLIVWLHGGPYRQVSLKRHPYISYGVYDWMLEEAVNNADAYVLKIDYPGSYGGGRAFTENIKGGVGTKDINSVMNVINDFTKNNTKINSVYVVGNSYGGYIATKIISSYPSKIDGALSINGVTDWKTLLIYYKNSIFNTLFNGYPSLKNKTLFTLASTTNNITKIKNPLYLIHGEADSTIPKSQSILFKKALDTASKESTLILIPNENHVFLKNSSINTICKTLFEMTHLNVTNSCNLKG